MNRSVKIIAVPLLALAAGGLAHADDGALRRYELPNLDSLELALPAGWLEEPDAPPGGGPLSIRFHPADGNAFEVFVTIESPEPTAPVVPDPVALREAVRDAAARVGARAVEDPIEIRHLQGGSGVGYYFEATDRAPQPEEFRVMHHGALQVGELTLWFTVLTQEAEDPAVALAISLLQQATHQRTGVDQR